MLKRIILSAYVFGKRVRPSGDMVQEGLSFRNNQCTGKPRARPFQPPNAREWFRTISPTSIFLLLAVLVGSNIETLATWFLWQTRRYLTFEVADSRVVGSMGSVLVRFQRIKLSTVKDLKSRSQCRSIHHQNYARNSF
jgi:hypothetical protein